MPSLLLQLMSTYYWKNSSKEDGRKKKEFSKKWTFNSKMKAGILSFYGMNIAKENASAETTLK